MSENTPPAIIPLADVDPALVEALLDRAFEPERRRRTAYKVREGTDWLPGLSFAALDEHDMLAGTIQCWPVALTDTAAGPTRWSWSARSRCCPASRGAGSARR